MSANFEEAIRRAVCSPEEQHKKGLISREEMEELTKITRLIPSAGGLCIKATAKGKVEQKEESTLGPPVELTANYSFDYAHDTDLAHVLLEAQENEVANYYERGEYFRLIRAEAHPSPCASLGGTAYIASDGSLDGMRRLLEHVTEKTGEVFPSLCQC